MSERVETRRLLRSLGQAVERGLRERPYSVLALAVALGYAAGDRLFSRLVSSLACVATVAAFLPRAAPRPRARVRAETSKGQPGAVLERGETA
jgi:hypothetical protein